MTYWDIFPFDEDGLKVAPLRPPVVPEKARAKFWEKVEKAEYKSAPRRYVEALATRMRVDDYIRKAVRQGSAV